MTVRILECRADAWVAGASKAVGACRDMSGHELPLWHGVPANSSEVQRGSARFSEGSVRDATVVAGSLGHRNYRKNFPADCQSPKSKGLRGDGPRAAIGGIL